MLLTNTCPGLRPFRPQTRHRRLCKTVFTLPKVAAPLMVYANTCPGLRPFAAETFPRKVSKTPLTHPKLRPGANNSPYHSPPKRRFRLNPRHLSRFIGA